MQLIAQTFRDEAPMPAEHAYGAIDPAGRVAPSANRNPGLRWSDVPEGARSFALICHDPDAPSRGDDVNQPGREVPADLPRVDFFHWVLVDIPRDQREIKPGSHSQGRTPRGKPGPDAPGGMRHGLNDYTTWFAGDKAMSGRYFGYDGPCPPWNDARIHRYIFTLYALAIERVPVDGILTGAQARAAITGHVLAEAALTGTYTLNPRLAGAR